MERDMNYEQIKDGVLHNTHSLKVIPPQVVNEVLGTHRSALPSISRPEFLRDAVHPRIECFTHTFLYTNRRNYYHVCSVLADGVPAFYFICLLKGGTEYLKAFILNEVVVKQFIILLVELDLEAQTSIYVRKVEASESVPELTSFQGVEIQYAQYGGECSDPRAIEYEY